MVKLSTRVCSKVLAPRIAGAMLAVRPVCPPPIGQMSVRLCAWKGIMWTGHHSRRTCASLQPFPASIVITSPQTAGNCTMVNKQRTTVEMGHKYNFHRPALPWKRAVAVTTLCLFSLYYLHRTFQKSTPAVELHQGADMAPSSFLQASALVTSLVALTAAQNQTATPTSATGWSTTLAGTPTSFRPVFTIPASADVGADVLPNIQDPQAVNAQDACPGYKASELKETDGGISAVLTLAGAPCNVYGNDVDVLNLKVEYQSNTRLAVSIEPAYIVRCILRTI